MGQFISDGSQLEETITQAVKNTAITDVHTHLYPPAFGQLMSSGVDDLLNYHYLIAEAFLKNRVEKEKFWGLESAEQAQFIWQRLFVDQRPLSEATRGVVTTLKQLGLNTKNGKLSDFREFFEGKSKTEMVDLSFGLSKVTDVVMTNDPIDEIEAAKWIDDSSGSLTSDRRFHSALRLDPILNDCPNTASKLRARGYEVDSDITCEKSRGETVTELSRFITAWIKRIDPVYLAASLPSSFSYPNQESRTIILDEVILPIARKFNLTVAIMAGTKRQINPDLRLAGDSVASTDISAIEAICRRNPNNRFLVTLLSREDQHRLTVVARKFSNLMIFGCWWFLNTPSLIEEITTIRFELLGTSFIPQHSDARVLEQLIYKWSHSRQIIAKVLTAQYLKLFENDWAITADDVEADVADLLANNFWNFIQRKPR
ncbi:MAG: glucuronate isomerase [Actinomycetota bacterium]|nr:glucuronate isomerase [Actinomycetota bacterium]